MSVIQFYDDDQPGLTAGTWTIEVAHTLAGIDTGSLGATQKFAVTAPQFWLDPSAVSSTYPPAGSTGQYDAILPHVVLGDPELPWERVIGGSGGTSPWMALLVLAVDELPAGTTPTCAQATTVDGFLHLAGPPSAPLPILVPDVTKAPDITGGEPCSYLTVPVTTFAAIAPLLAEVPLLSHVRATGGGTFSVVVANRFPTAPAAGSPPAQYVAHLVSLEGLGDYLVAAPDFGSNTSVALASLASWTFACQADPSEEFAPLWAGIVAEEAVEGATDPSQLWLRLPEPTPPIDTGTAAGVEAEQRRRDGFVALPYALRTGEQTLGWYRGPVVPLVTTAVAPSTPWPTSDAALVYDPAYGVFDTSLAAAWQAGRALALADQSFGQQLMDFRLQVRRLTDALLLRLQSDHFSATQIAELSTDTSVADAFLEMLSSGLIETLTATSTTGAQPSPPPPPPSDPDPQAAVTDFLADPDARQLIATLTAADLAPIAAWLRRLWLLGLVPYPMLVPAPAMAPVESLRFGYLDDNWRRALVDGALSIGLQSSWDTLCTELMGPVLWEAAGIPTALPAANPTSAFLLTSAIVSGWPGLLVTATASDGTDCPFLRLDRLAGNVLFGLVSGVPATLEFAEPHETLRFGVDDDGQIPVRQPLPTAGTALGTQVGPALAVVPDALRPGPARVLDLASDAATDLLTTLGAALTPLGGPASPGAAELALQLVQAPEAICFTVQPG